MPTLADLVNARTRTPTATVKIGGRIWRAIVSLKTSQAFGSGISTGTVIGRSLPVSPSIGTTISWSWGYNGVEVAGFTGEIARPARKSYPNRYTLECRDVLWRAGRSNQVIATSPLNSITASAAIRYILVNYGGIPSSRISLPTFSASGSEWGGSEWTLGILTPVQWGNTDDNSGGTSALQACRDICSVLGYWLYADAAGIIRAKQMERAPSSSPVHTFRRGVDLLTNGSPELVEDVDAVKNRRIVKGGNTGVDGAQIMDTYQTDSDYLPPGVYQEETFSSFLIEYVNESQAGAASATAIARRQLNVSSRLPVIVRHRTKADPHLSVGATVGIVDTGIGYTTAKNFFIYGLETSLDLQSGDFSQNHTLDGGTGSPGYTTIPPPDASFSWRLDAETLNGDAVVVVSLDGSGSTSLSGGLIVSWDWSTSTTTYGGSPATATGVKAMLVFLASEGTADITLTVTDTTSKTDTLTAPVDLTGADTQTPIRRTLSVAFGSAWAVTPDGGATWNVETSNGDAIAVGTIGAGADDRAPANSGSTYGLLATRGALGIGLRQTLDALSTPSTNLVAAGGAVTSNIWVNEANPLRVWFAVGTILYRSVDRGATKTAMAAAPATIHWVQEDASVDNSVFILAGADMLNATNPAVGYAVLYAGPVGATARQFVRSRDGQVTWIAYTGAPTGESLQRVENGAAADWSATDCRTLALDNAASSFLATLTAVTADNPAQIWTFDGLTGLSAGQATPTLPTGATAMHMLADPDVDLYYIADFDSVAVGTGAVRKFLADQLFLYKAGAVGQQAHMLGFGAAEQVVLELWYSPANATGAADKFFHYTATAGWVSITPPQAGWYWHFISAAPDAPDSLLAFGNTANNAQMDVTAGVMKADGTAVSPMYRSDDAGATWTEVTLSGFGVITEVTLEAVAWDDAGGDGWGVVANKVAAPFYPTYFLRGSGTSASVTTTTATQIEILIGTSGLSGDLIVADFGTPYKLGYYTSAGVLTEAGGSAPSGTLIAGDRLGGPSPAVAALRGADLWVTNDYRDAQPALALAGTNGSSVTATYEAVYIGGATGVIRVSDPAGTPVQSVVGPIGIVTGPVRQARQGRSTTIALAVRLDPTVSKDLYISRDGITWSFLAGPSAAIVAKLGAGFEVVTR